MERLRAEFFPPINEHTARVRPPEQIQAVHASVLALSQRIEADAVGYHVVEGWDQFLPGTVKDPLVLFRQRQEFLGITDALYTALGYDDTMLLKDISQTLAINPFKQPDTSMEPVASKPRSKEELMGAIRTLLENQEHASRMGGAAANPISEKEWVSALRHPALSKRFSNLPKMVDLDLALARNTARLAGLRYALGEDTIPDLTGTPPRPGIPRQRLPS